ncbi:MAG: glucose-6-phosphate isomerase [Phycisphaeraceae bacterium]|nr:glucose-6-phosphate isomerase [Phycisphaeraceae bacterium]
MPETALDVRVSLEPLDLSFGPGCFGPRVERRTLDAIRPSLRDPHCVGPDVVYAIAMDVGREPDRADLQQRNLLFGIVVYAAGRLGDEPIRSQGHVHKASPRHGWSTPEVYEIWQGSAIILMQEHDSDDPGRCFAVEAGPGEVVIVPPRWAHATISADVKQPLVFGAWCDRDYGFVYDGVRAHGGLAYFPLLTADGAIEFQFNPHYQQRPLTRKPPRNYADLGLESGVPIYQQYQQHHERFMFVPEPMRAGVVWGDYTP